MWACTRGCCCGGGMMIDVLVGEDNNRSI